MKSLIILCLFIFVSISKASIWTGNYTTTHYRANWTIDTVSSDIIIDFSADTAGWISLAFGTLAGNGSMIPCDPYTGWVGDTSGTVSMFDTWSTANAIPALDIDIGGTGDILAFNGHQAAGPVTYLHFQRLLNTGDTHDIPVTNTNMFLIWAYATSDGTSGTSYPIHTSAGSQQLNFFQTLVSQTSTTGAPTTGKATTTAGATTGKATTTGQVTTTGVATTAAKVTTSTTTTTTKTTATTNTTANAVATTTGGTTLPTAVVAGISVAGAVVLLGVISFGVGICYRMHEKRNNGGS